MEKPSWPEVVEEVFVFGRAGRAGWGIAKLSEFEQKYGNARIHHSLIVQHSGYWPEVENQPNLT